MKKLLKITLLTALAIMILVSCEFGLPEATEVEVGKFVEAYNMAGNISNADNPYDTKIKTSTYGFDFNVEYDNTNISSYICRSLGIWQSTPSEDFSLSFNVKGSVTNELLYESDSNGYPFNPTEFKKHVFSFYFSDFEGTILEDETERLASFTYPESFINQFFELGESVTTFKDFLPKVFAKMFKDGEAEVTITVVGDFFSGTKSYQIEGIDLYALEKEDSAFLTNFLESLYNYMFSDRIEKNYRNENGDLSNLYKDVWVPISNEDSSDLKSYSYELTCEKALSFSDTNYFSEIKDSKFYLKSEVTEEGKELIVGPTFAIKMDLGFLIQWEMDADIIISAKLDGKDYVFTYSTDTEVLSINGRLYSCPTWNFN